MVIYSFPVQTQKSAPFFRFFGGGVKIKKKFGGKTQSSLQIVTWALHPNEKIILNWNRIVEKMNVSKTISLRKVDTPKF